ncbi:redoxin domain-containing protein [Ligilactobacillus ceti]|uniref:Glutathione peroxidase n=1 Tax=Ligilactobacillus ceti DSM 22408 TaxID=1122146 RepID=A0A0R2KHQ0_9LACO|nr:redoxin domain-containing protein [Ligilactobacillus ceti]KRN88899.1 hypothetical protein IV53_GL000869 [Ligilactobacillus ceti DSM 22408]
MNIYDFAVLDHQNQEVLLKDFQNKVILIVNTAENDPLFPERYEKLTELYQKYHQQGLEIIDIPCQEFTPDDVENIRTAQHVFPKMQISAVNGNYELPLYTFLKTNRGFAGFGNDELAHKMEVLAAHNDPDYKATPDIKWNFTTFIIDRQGDIFARFEPNYSFSDLENIVKMLLASN